MKLSDFRKVDAGLTELHELLARFNDTSRPYPRDRTVHALFSQQAALRPDAVALVHGEAAYSYRQLEQASNRFARFLIGHGVEHEGLVALLLDRPFEMVVALLGVLKAGGAYVPIDPAAPFDRMRHLLDSVGARIIVSEKRYLRLLNRLQWDCPRLGILFCADSYDVCSEPEDDSDDVQQAVWDKVGLSACDDISAGGWASIYTGDWLGRDEISAYVDNVHTKLSPYLTRTTRVLDIGCGSGLTLSRLAPLVGFYLGADLSRPILDWTERDLARRDWPHVRLRHCPAHEIDRIDENGFDVVILNRVVEFFAGHNYLRNVLRKAMSRMAERGVVFLGCIWNTAGKEPLVRSLQDFRSTHVGKGYRTKLDHTDGLFLSRDFLEDLRHEFPEIRSVECSAACGPPGGELSDHCFDAVLQVDRSAVPGSSPRARRKFQFDLRALEGRDESPLAERSSAESLAYVIHTSGTSGAPKGVMVEHRAIVRLVMNTDYVQLGPDDRVLQTGPLAFDASTFEIWGPLLNGGGMCRPAARALLDAAEVARLIARHRITTMFVTTGLFNQYVDSDVNVFAGLKHLLTGGERASPYHFEKVRARYPHLIFLHVYGPTENTTFTTHFRIDRSYSGDVPIGRPIANSQVLILDANGSPVPVGVPGEICAAGDGLARGYLNDAQLTERKFVRHPWKPEERIYRTGDSGLWRADGTIEYLGRLDDQVKIRGYRIEPAEVEHHLRSHGDVRQAVVIVKETSTGKELVAYVTARKGGAEALAGELREWLERLLPEYMVPAHIVGLKRMPLNANGKVDRTGLPDPVCESRPGAAPCEPPATATEREVLAIWEEVLGRSPIGVTDNFFDRGGHSLRIAKALSLIERRLGVAVPLTVFFTFPTVRELAGCIVDGARFGVPGIDDAMVPLSRTGRGPVLFAFPPGTGDALGFAQLASLLPCPFYGFNFIEAQTRLQDYVDLMTRVQPDGPYVMFGYSSGGNLAYHVARELEDRGLDVAAIVMADSARRLRPMPLAEAEIVRVSGNFLGDESVRSYLASAVLRDKAERLVRASLNYAATAVDYHTIRADIHVVTSENSIAEYHDESGNLMISQSGWADVTRGRLHVHSGFGHHNHMLAHPHLDRNAEVIARIIDRIARSAASRNRDRAVGEGSPAASAGHRAD
jgi:amino acid adenylation domain-containing protein